MPTVLLIEPHTGSARRYAQSLQQAGFRVEAISSDADRQEFPADLIVISVPQLERSELRNFANGRSVPKIALSSEAADADRAREFGCAAVLIRPVMYDDLVTQVRRVMKTAEQPA